MSSSKIIWGLLLVFVLLDGIYGPEDDDPTVRGTTMPITPEELAEVPRDFFSTSDRAKRSLLSEAHGQKRVLPKTFRIESKWKACEKNVYEIAHQGRCGICHSVSGASVMSNRWCIALVDKLLDHIPAEQRSTYTFDDQISAFHVAACHDHSPAADPTDVKRCTDGSNHLRVYRHAVFTGYVTGGLHDSKQGCLPYPFLKSQTVDQSPMTCPDKKGQPFATCTNTALPAYPRTYQQDFRQIESYWCTKKDMLTDKTVTMVDRMKYEISTYGPITAVAHFPDELTKAVVLKDDQLATIAINKVSNHGVRIIGWDVCDATAKVEKICWLVANSWGKKAHQDGILLIETGYNVLGIEEGLSAPVIALKGRCEASTFLTQAIDTAVWIKDGLYLFQGQCAQRLKYTGGQLRREGAPDLVQRIFVGAPPAVVGTLIVADPVSPSNDLVPAIVDGHGGAVLIHRQGTPASATPVKYVCRWNHIENYKPEEPAALWIEGTSPKQFGVTEFRKVPALTPERFATINAMLYLGDGLIAIFGQELTPDKHFIAGVFSGSTMNMKYDWIVKPALQSKVLESMETIGVKRGAPSEQQNQSKYAKS